MLLLPPPALPSLRDAARSARRSSPSSLPSSRARSSPAPASSADGGLERLLSLGANETEAAALAPHVSGSSDELAARMLRYCRVLGVSPFHAVRLATSVPALDSLDVAELSARLAALRSALPAGTDAAAVVGRAPTLIFETPEALSAARAELSAFLPPCLLVPLLEEEPSLLLLAHRAKRLPELKAKLLLGPFAALLPTYEPDNDADRRYLRRYAQGALALPSV